MRTRSHSPAPSGPRLSQIEFDTPSRPSPCTSPARRSVIRSPAASSSCAPAAAARSATARAWPSVYGDLRSTKSATATSAASNCSPDSWTPSAGSAAITASQVRAESSPSRIASASAHSNAESVGIELRAGALAGQRRRRLDPADAVGHLDVLGQLREPRGDRHRVTLELPRPPVAVPLLVRRADRLLHGVRQSELLGQRPGDRRVPGDHPVEVAPPGERELQAHPEAVQRRVARPDAGASPRPHRPRSAARARTCRP